MKRLCGLCILTAVFLCSCGVNVAQKSPELTSNQAETGLKPTGMTEETPSPKPTRKPTWFKEKRNITIKGRRYKYVAYAHTGLNEIALLSLKTEDEILYIPSEMEGRPVVIAGWPPGLWPEQVDANKLGWNLGKKKKHLKQIIIEEGIKDINSFEKVVADEIVIPKSVQGIAGESFYGAKIRKVLIKNSKASLGTCAFGKSTLEQIHLPDDFHGKIGNGCFSGSNLKEFRWPAYGRQKKGDFGESVFEECNKLKKITFPEKQQRIIIPYHSFFWCKSLTKLEFPASTGKVLYKVVHYADNYKHGVSTLIFKGKDTKLEGVDIQDVNSMTATKVPDGFRLITVKKIIAPRGSKAIRFAKKAVKIAELNEWKEKDVTCENRLNEPAVIPEDLVPVEYEIRNG